VHSLIIIRRLQAGFILMLFAFSITPKKFLHDLVANHRDARYVSIKSLDGKDQLGNAGYHCPCDQLVAQTPFVYQTVVFERIVFSVPAVYQRAPIVALHTPLPAFSFLRGPPALMA